MRVVLASNNAHKLAELRSLFAGLSVELVAQPEFRLGEAAEPHPTFIENALAKARFAAAGCGLAALADDSGLCVDALAGAPGVLSARYASLFGEPAGDEQNNRELLRNMAGQRDRSARFIGVLVAVRSADDPEPLVAVGRWHGRLLEAPRGAGGFGYDPLLWIDAFGCSVGELAPETKNRHSHRARAARRMRRLMREVWGV